MEIIKKILTAIAKFFKKFKVLIILLIVGFIILTFVLYTKNMAKQVMGQLSGSQSETAEIEARDLVETITATGTIESAKKRTVASTIIKDTKITSVNCEVGDEVQEGQILVTFSYDNINKTIAQLQEDIAESKATKAIDDTANTRTYFYSYGTETIAIRDLQIAIAERQKELNEACDGYGDEKRKLEDLKSQRDGAPDKVDPATVSVNGAVMTKSDYDTLIEAQENTVAAAYQAQEAAQTAYNKAVLALGDEIYKGSNTLVGANETYQKNVITSNDGTKNLQRQLEEYTDKLDDYVITAPISGTVTSVEVEEDNSFAGGNLVTIQDCSTLYVSTEIDEYDIPNVRIGQRVILKTDATREDELEGVIEEIATTATGTSGTANTATSSSSTNATYSVKVRIITKDDRLKLGMSAKLSIVTNEAQGVLTVPYDAVVDKGDGQYVIYTVDDETMKKVKQNEQLGEDLKNGKIPDLNKGEVSGPQIVVDGEKPDDKGGDIPDIPDIPGKPGKTTLKDVFKIAYSKSDEQAGDLIEENKVEVPVQIGMESDYYTQVMGPGVKEGMTVVIEQTVEADNPFDVMFGF
ncbi:MAG: efflux RND transporter periplasmic adaptor subunit [Lachnospiraceae bacterium]|nr:efflux RND transporter periplasmic adaptor subunit [Lachnospiraceae bacterium]